MRHHADQGARSDAVSYLRGKRGLNRELHQSDDSVGGNSAFFNARLSNELTPADAAEFADQFTRLIGSLDEEGRLLVDLKLQQCTNVEIAERMGLSERTVRRILNACKPRSCGISTCRRAGSSLSIDARGRSVGNGLCAVPARSEVVAPSAERHGGRSLQDSRQTSMDYLKKFRRNFGRVWPDLAILSLAVGRMSRPRSKRRIAGLQQNRSWKWRSVLSAKNRRVRNSFPPSALLLRKGPV